MATTTAATTFAPFTYPTRPPTPAPGSEQVATAHPATPWIPFIVLSLLLTAAMAAAGWFYSYRTALNAKFAEELRTTLLTSMSNEDRPYVRKMPHQLRVDPSAMPPPVIPDDGKTTKEREKIRKEKKRNKKARAQ